MYVYMPTNQKATIKAVRTERNSKRALGKKAGLGFRKKSRRRSTGGGAGRFAHYESLPPLTASAKPRNHNSLTSGVVLVRALPLFLNGCPFRRL
jgi:hypothetical protein